LIDENRGDRGGRSRWILRRAARRKGSDVGPDSASKTLAILDGLPADTTSSMQRDVVAGRPSELNAQTGAVVRFGREVGVPTPVHDTIYAELLPLEKRARGVVAGIGDPG
jgi:2-dehydropantoate 2-reductase